MDFNNNIVLARLLDDIVNLFKRYVSLPGYGYEAIALYIAQTYLIEWAEFAPLLVLTSPEMQAGKTTTLTLIGELVMNPLGATNVSPAGLYQAVERDRPTFMIDEYDSLTSIKTEKSEALRNIINAGHRRGRYSVVIRGNERGTEQKEYNVFGFKILAGIGALAGTIADRSIMVKLQRDGSGKLERLRIRKIEPELMKIREDLAEVMGIHGEAICTTEPIIPTSLSGRQADNWELMLAIADFAGGAWPETARHAAVSLLETRSLTTREQLLKDIRDFFNERDTDFTSSGELVGYLKSIETSPWAEWKHHKGLTVQTLALLLKDFDIVPSRVLLGGTRARGYTKEMFTDSFERYLPPLQGETVKTNSGNSPTRESPTINNPDLSMPSETELF